MTTDEQNLRDAITELRITVGALAETVNSLKVSVERSVSMSDFANLKRDVDGLLSVKEWAFRIVIGAVILALLALVLKQNGGL